jgi:hypothetical protein
MYFNPRANKTEMGVSMMLEELQGLMDKVQAKNIVSLSKTYTTDTHNLSPIFEGHA